MSLRLLTIALSTLVSEDLTAIATGLLVHAGEIPFLPALAACAAGIYLGDLGLWAVGRALGPRVLRWRGVSAVLPEARVQLFREWVDRNAFRVILGSRFAPGSRLPLYLASGACGTSPAGFAAASLVAVLLWTPALVGISALMGEGAASLLGAGLAGGRLAALMVTVVVFAGWRLCMKAASVRGRQKLAAAMAKVWRWEFWPMWLFYAPVLAWTAWLACRYRGYRTITAANPGMPDGGVVGESKFEILSRLPPEWTVPTLVVREGSDSGRLPELQQALDQRGWSFPLVLKPDVGERGLGVRLVRSAAEAGEYLAQAAGRTLAQPYHPGPFEAGIFYYRLPGAARGAILSITDKHFPFVAGDGRSSLEDLIWAHPRYRVQARTFLSRLGPRRAEVPASGARVALAIAGNHAQGTMFRDGRRLKTRALEDRIEAIARSYDGFFIGRFDVRYRDREAFMAGRDLAIVELNGATAESTNIYDPDGSLLAAYRQLFVQWRLVFQIGAANRRAGRAATSTARLVQLLRAHLNRAQPFPIAD